MTERGELLESFAAEAHRRCASISSTVSMIELGQGPPSGLYDAAVEAHALKGAAGVLELPDIAELAAQLESMLEHAGEGPLDPADVARVNTLASGIDDGARAAAEAEAQESG